MDNILVINSVDSKGDKLTKTINRINPEADNADLSTFGKMANALTTNELVSLQRVYRYDITEPGEEYITPDDPIIEVTVPGETVTVDVEVEVPVTVQVPVDVTVPVEVTVAGNAKTNPTFSLGEWYLSNNDVYSNIISYNGDGTLSTDVGTINGSTISVADEDGRFSGAITATEGNNYAAGRIYFGYYTDQTGDD